MHACTHIGEREGGKKENNNAKSKTGSQSPASLSLKFTFNVKDMVL